MLNATTTRPNSAETFDPQARARALLPLLARNAEQCEKDGRITDEVFAALRQAGLFAITAPLRAGGPGAKLITHIETVVELAKGCVGTAWAYSLLSSVTASVKSMPQQIQEQVFRRGDELFCSVAAQTGYADPIEGGGYRISGKWGFASGCRHASWALNGIAIRDTAGQVVDSGFALIGLEHPQVEILDNWHVAGMAGSGSNMIVADNVVVPESLLLRASRRPPVEALHTMEGLEPRDRWPTEPLFPLIVLAPMLGAATAMLESVVQTMGSRPVVWWSYPSQKDSQRLVGGVGQAALEIDSAWLHVRRAAAMLDETAQQRLLTGFEKVRIQADCGFAMGLLRDAGNRLMDIAGPGAFALSNPLQRLWRDLNVGTRHNAMNQGLSIELYGRAMLGLESSLSLLADIGPVPDWAVPR
ncbi:Flavin-dependent monooxygenase, oxygenase subunit HsaA [compost metagenome]|jgi:alkylation response protein AidB-like acyl-CoA dehydrogenase